MTHAEHAQRPQRSASADGEGGERGFIMMSEISVRAPLKPAKTNYLD